MPITAQSADGVSHEFPDGTERTVIDRVMKDYATKQAPPQQPPEGKLERIGHGLMDPIYGAAQIGARMPEEGAAMGLAMMGKTEEAEAERQGRQETVDKTVKEREADIQSHRPEAERGTTDWLRVAGSIPSTAALAPGGPGIGGAVISGALGSAIQPTTDTEHFGLEKAKNAAVGGALGGVIGTVAKGAGAVYSAIKNPESKAMGELARAAERDGTSLDDLQTRLTQARQIRPNATIADVAGENVRGLVERIGQTPGAGRAKLAPRMTADQQAQLQRSVGDLRTLTGTDQRAFEAVEETIEARSSEAAPLYQQAYTDGDREIWSQEINRLTGAPEVQRAMRMAVSGWQRRQIADGYGAVSPRALGSTFREVEGVNVGQPFQVPTGRVPVFPDLQFWDYTKDAIDGMIAKEIKPDGTMTRKGRDLTIIVNSLKTELDRAVPSYEAARAAWGGRSQYLNAIEEGRTILSTNVGSEEMAANFARMSDANKSAYRIGAISALMSRMGGSSAKLPDFTVRLRSPEMRAKIAAMMPDEATAQRWLQSLDYEVQKSELAGQSLAGSRTAIRTAQREDEESMVADLALHALAHEPIGLLKSIFKGLSTKTKSALRSRSDSILVDILTTPEGAASAMSRETPTEGAGAAMQLLGGPLAAGAGSALAQPGASP